MKEKNGNIILIVAEVFLVLACVTWAIMWVIVVVGVPNIRADGSVIKEFNSINMKSAVYFNLTRMLGQIFSLIAFLLLCFSTDDTSDNNGTVL